MLVQISLRRSYVEPAMHGQYDDVDPIQLHCYAKYFAQYFAHRRRGQQQVFRQFHFRVQRLKSHGHEGLVQYFPEQ